MGFFITEEKELPEFSNQDANKVLKVDASGLYLQWLQETTTPAELPSQAGNSGKLLTTNGTTPSWTDALSVSTLTSAGNIHFSNNNSQFSQLRRNDNVNIVLQDDGSGTRTMTFNIGNVSTTRRRLFIQQGTFTVENSRFVVSDSSQIHSIAGVLNLSTAGSASAPTLMFGDNTDTPVASRSGIWGTNDVIRFGTDGTERVTIRNDGLTVPDGSTAAPSYSFENSTNSGLVRTLVGTDNGIGFVANGTQVCSIVGGNIRLSGGASIRNNVGIPSSNIQFIGSTGGATGYIQMTFSDSTTGTSATYRLGNGTNWPATETVMSKLVGGTGTNEIFATEHGNTYFRFLGATGTGATLPTRVQRVEINNSGMSITGDLSVTGRCTIPDVVYPFDVFTSSGSTADFTLAQSTKSNVRLEMDTINTILRFPALVEGTFYRIVPFRNGTTATLSFRPGNSVIMYLYSGGSRSTVTGNVAGTNGFFVLPGTFYECIFSAGAWYIVAQHPVANCTMPADLSVEEAMTMKKTVRTPISSVNYNAINITTTSPMIIRALISGSVASSFNLPSLGETATGQTHIIIPYKDSASTATLQMWTGGGTGHAIHVMSNATKTVVTGSTTYPLVEGVVYTCVWHWLSSTAGQLQGIWYVFTTGQQVTVGDPFVVASTIDFFSSGSAIARILGDNAGANSSMSMIINGTTNMKYTVNDTEVQNSLRLFKAPITDWIIVDSSTHEVSRNSPSKIILTKGTTGSSNATVVFPTSDSVPNGLTIQVMVWMLPDRTGTGTQRVRFDSASPTNNAFVLGSSGTGIALGGTTYTVTEGTNFTATNFRTTIGRWMVDSTRFNSTPALTAA
jgi:hypothetical protein